MTDYPDTAFKIGIQGAAIVNSAWIVYKTDQVILIEVDLKTKYARVNSFCENEVFIECSAASLYTDQNVSIEEDTWVEFPEAEGYSFFGASSSRYTIQLTFFRRNV